jgi:archaeosine-15-forming tRNA-guanine transglycosylase
MVQDLKMEIEALKSRQVEATLEMENLGKKCKHHQHNTSLEDTIAEINISVKENDKYKMFLTQSIQEIWDTMKRPNLRIIVIEEDEDSQFKRPESIFDKIIEENFTNLKKEMTINM